ncbi:MAG TPA: response regulator, partial [Candidatus Acidoferrum sp.]|nr:response regulator [Candidatus Acidoferrum sp.]
MTPRQKTRPPKKILIVDDHPMMREGLAQLIGHDPALRVCGDAGDAAAALEKTAALKPDLVLVDLSLPGKNGLELIKDMQA